MIYFIRNGRCIKAGFSNNIEKRMRAFRSSVPEMELLGTMPGTRGHERTLHNLLAPYHVNREWFKDCPEVHEIIQVAIDNGVEEWKATRNYSFEENEWGRHVARLVDIISEGKSAEDFPAIESSFGLSSGLIWQVKYRPREASVGNYFALIKAAAKVIDLRRLALEERADFVRSLEVAHAESDNNLLDVERAYFAMTGNRLDDKMNDRGFDPPSKA